MRSRLIIIGAGPKAMAIASKAVVLKELGYRVPEIHIIEKTEVGANWTGTGGFTNGRLHLGTSPEKDVGFPYASSDFGHDNDRINRRMRDFSWQSFLISKGRYSEWVDRGRPAPEHRQWAAYLQWVYGQVSENTVCHKGEVVGLELKEDLWRVTYRNGVEETIEGEGLVMTGPGKIRLDDELPADPRVLTVETFWKRYRELAAKPGARFLVVGAGENAASIAMSLATSGTEIAIDILSPYGMAFSRGESYLENRVYSSAETAHWGELSETHRREFIHRTDRGVFSLYSQEVLGRAENITVLPGRLTAARPDTSAMEATIEYAGKRRTHGTDYIVLATGADQLSFLREMMSDGTEKEITRRTGLEAFSQPLVEKKVGPALELSGLAPRLHLPMLSGIEQGPGFANLSCLGQLSDRLLRPYLA